MKQVLVKKSTVVVSDVPAPMVDDGSVLVEVMYSLISTGTEISGIDKPSKALIQQAFEKPEKIQKLVKYVAKNGVEKTLAKIQGKLDAGNPTGYSCSGIVLCVGKDVADIKPGDSVACGGGGFASHAEIVMVPRKLVVKIPDGCSNKDAASATVGAIAMQGVRRADLKLGELVAVIGLGLLGQMTVQLLKSSGCRVFGFDLDKRRCALARELGAEWTGSPGPEDARNVIRQLSGDHGVDATIITAASRSDAIVQQAMDITRKRGRIVVVGAVGLGLQRSPFYEKEIDFLISCSYGPGRYDEQYEIKGKEYPYAYVRWTENRNMEEFLRQVAEKRVILDKIIEKEYPLEQAPQAFASLQSPGEKPLGILLVYPSDGTGFSGQTIAHSMSLPNKTVSEKIRVAIVGAGSFAKGMHIPNLLKMKEQYQLYAVVDAVGHNAKTTAELNGACIASTDYEDVLGDKNVDMVIVTTRHNLHAPMTIRAIKAGKAILVEKPMALSMQEIEQVSAALSEKPVPFMVGFNRRFSPFAKRIKDSIADRKNPMMIYYRMNAGYLPLTHWTQTGEGGGRIVGEGCHILDLFRYLTNSPAVDFSCTPIVPKTEHITGTDNTSITVRYENGSVATLLYTSQGTPTLSKEYMELYCDGKVFVLDDYLSLREYGSKVKEWKLEQQDKGHFEELLAFAKSVRGETPVPISLESMIETTTITVKAAGQ